PLTLACGGDESTGGAGGTAGAGGAGGTGSVFSADPPLVLDEDERPAMVAIPSDYDPETSYPLVIVLHGFGVTGAIQAGFWRMFDAIDEKQFVMVYPDGIDASWNATEACCDPTGEVDDVGYVSGLIEEAQEVYNIDADRVYLMGHSNGGFMSFRMACERSDLITAIVSLAGSTFDDPADCQPATLPVSVLAVHSTNDGTIFYDGGTTVFGGDYPGAVETVERFAAQAGCDVGSTTMLESIDLTNDYDGAETERVAYTTGCDAGLDAELWTLLPLECAATACNPHIPVFTEVWADVTTDWLFRHSR
ncbi:MAG: alpha/beta hydrolase-fold protein, partial [Myxococcales bacterium]|nr:alpha/beta hydrolase-fold protein [Myxococcales bacterium]